MISFDNILNILKYIISKKRTKIGFVVFLVLVFLILIYAPPFNSIVISIRMLGFIMIGCVSFTIWLYLSGRLVWPSRKIIIAFALKSLDAKTQNIINTTMSMIEDRLNALNILQNLKIIEVGTDIFKTQNQAKKYAKKRNISMLIHGTVYGENDNEKYCYKFKDPLFTYQAYVQKNSPHWQILQNDINLILAHRIWTIGKSDSVLSDAEKVSGNFVEILLSIISISLSGSRKHINLSISLIETLLPFLEKQISPSDRVIKISKNKTKFKAPLNLFRSGRLRAILHQCYIVISRVYIEEKNYSEAILVLKKGLGCGANKYDCFCGLALASYHQSGIKEAELYTNELNKVKRNTPIYFLNTAFFSIKKKQYSEAIRFYNLARKNHTIENQTFFNQAISFLTERKNENNDELAYSYGIGVLTYNCIDKEDGMKILSKFIKESYDVSDYIEMNKTARFILKT